MILFLCKQMILIKQFDFLTMRINTLIGKNICLSQAKWTVIRNPIQMLTEAKNCSTKVKDDHESSQKFETVFSFPFVRHVATLNRIKMYHLLGTTLAVPGCGLMESLGAFSNYSFLAAAYIGVTGGILLSLASLPFNNTIGFLYISEDDKYIKISSVDFWGRRKDRIIPVDMWTPLLEMKPKTMDAIYLTPQLTDGTKYKLFIKFGKELNSSKIGQILE